MRDEYKPKVICPVCKGKGTNDNETKICSKCKGMGVIIDPDYKEG